MQSNAPDLSMVIVTPDRYDTIRGTVGHLRRQNVAAQIEIVIVAPEAEELGIDPAECAAFFGVRVVPVGLITSSARARAAGVWAASAPVVAFAEDHAFLGPGSAEALIEAHRGPWAAVAGIIRNANPGSAIGWANLLIEYAPWMEPVQGGEVDHLPGHNGSYKRELLLAYGDRLEALLEAESVLQWDLRARGFRLLLVPAIKTYHRNITRVDSTVALRFHGGRLFAAARARGWALPRRLLYASAAPLIPLVRLGRIWRQATRRGRPRALLPALIAGLAIDGAGEMIGYGFGGGDAVQRSSAMEFHRERHLAGRMRGVQTSAAPSPPGLGAARD